MDKVNQGSPLAQLAPDRDKLYTESDFQEGRTVVQFRDNELLICDMGGRPPDDQQTEIINQARKKAYGGKMSIGAQKRLARSLTILAQSVKAKWVLNPATGRLQYFKLALITVTVSSRSLISHKDIKRKLLDPFLRWLRYSKNCRRYVWRAELQQRGQIHYHIVIDRMIHYQEIRDRWNRLQRDNGYLREYTARTKKIDPNSTDVKAVGNEKKLAKYLIKYLGKDEDTAAMIRKKRLYQYYREGSITASDYEREIAETDKIAEAIDGKVWDCSDNLNVRYFTLMLTWRGGMNLAQYIRDHIDNVHYGERFMSIEMDFNDPPDFMVFAFKRFKMYLDVIAAGGMAAIHN